MTRPYHSDWIDGHDNYRLVAGDDGVYRQVGRPLIVCLCGSTRFWEQFQEANYRETMAGRIVLTVGHYPNIRDLRVTIDGCMGETPTIVRVIGNHGDGIGCTPEQKVALDSLHKQKIDLADEVYVLNVGGYVGDSTRSEVRHALKNRKPVRWLEPDKVPADLTA
jgi:hypothetical protein